MTRGSVSRPSSSTAPSTARSASRLWGGIFVGTSMGLIDASHRAWISFDPMLSAALRSGQEKSSRNAAAVNKRWIRGGYRVRMTCIRDATARRRALASLLADDVDAEPGRDVLVQPDRDERLTERLDRLVQRHPAALHLDRVLRQEIDDVLRGHRAEELAFLRGLTPLFVDQRLDPITQGLGVRLDAAGLGVLLRLDVVEVLQIAGGGGEGELLRDQIVARVAVRDLTDIAATADLGDVVQQDDLHRGSSYSVARYGSRATVRARLIACVSWRWCRAQLPEMRRGMILPRSLTSVRSRRTSL